MRLFGLRFRWFLCVSLGVWLSAFFVFDVAGAASSGWLVRPFDQSVGESGRRTWFLYGVDGGAKNGSRIDDAVEFWNQREETMKVVVEPADAKLLNGAFALSEPGSASEFIGKWVNISGDGMSRDRVVTVGAGQKKIFPFSVNIPEGVANGDYWGGVTVREIVPHGSAWRVGVRVMVRVGATHVSASGALGSGVIGRLPQGGGKVAYYPELTLFLQRLSRVLPAPFGRG